MASRDPFNILAYSVLHRPGRFGLSLVEIMIGLAIGAMLLLSLVVAIQGSVSAADKTDSYNHAIQSARLASMRISSEVRNSPYIEVTDIVSQNGTSVWGRQLNVARSLDSSGHPIDFTSYVWSPSTSGLRYIPSMGSAGALIAPSVSNLSFQVTYERDSNGQPIKDSLGNIIYKTGSVTMTVRQGSMATTISNSIALRRNMKVFALQAAN